jgi:hypothetical protein
MEEEYLEHIGNAQGLDVNSITMLGSLIALLVIALSIVLTVDLTNFTKANTKEST